MDQNYISKERFKELQEELAALKKTGKLEIAARLKFAKELGDLSENSEYKEAREAQAQVEARILELEELLRVASIIKKSDDSSVVRVGAKVKVKKGGDILEFTIVGSSDAEPGKGFVSNESPIGNALLGKKVGEKAAMKTPKGDITFEILGIE